MKNSFIPKEFRPIVPGSKLVSVTETKQNYSSFLDSPKMIILFISAREDIVPKYFLKEIDYPNCVIHLYYDELGISWDFSFVKNDLTFYINDKKVKADAIYHRHPGVSPDNSNYNKHLAFFEVLDIWKGKLLGQKRDHFHNFSKAFQGITSIKKSSTCTGKKIKYPRSFFLKGDYSLLRFRFEGQLVVKSCSSNRSKVVTEEIFSSWNFDNLNNLPVFFQEKIDGIDVRVHVCENLIWPLMVLNKDCIDYRYASKGTIHYQKTKLPDSIIKFCKSISLIEKNIFIGIDLLKTDNEYYCLESNPGPGWSTYQHSSKKKFAQKLYNKFYRT